MEKTYSSEELAPIEYYPQPDGKALVVLRENIEQNYRDNDDGTSFAFWQADEVQVVTDLAEDEIEDNFDALWVRGVTESKTVEERLAEIEENQDIIIAAILEGSE